MMKLNEHKVHNVANKEKEFSLTLEFISATTKSTFLLKKY